LQSNGESIELRPQSAIALGSLYAARDAAEAGAALVPEFITAEGVSSGTLVQILPQWCGPATDISVVYPSRRHVSARLRAFIDLLLAIFPDRTLETSRGINGRRS
jgi:DNA-binding transcriptional LysR family regulator